MHELGIVFHMVDMLEELGEENSLSSIAQVNLKLGEVSGVLPDYLIDCWDWAASKHELLRGCKLNVEPVEAITVCNACGKTYGTLEHGRICPHCQSDNTELLQGLEIEIESIEAC